MNVMKAAILVEKYVQQVEKYLYDSLGLQLTENEFMIIAVSMCVIAAVTGLTALRFGKREKDDSQPREEKDSESENEEDVEFELESIKNEVEHSEDAIGIEGELNSIKNKVKNSKENIAKVDSSRSNNTHIRKVKKYLDFAKRAKSTGQYDQALSTCQRAIDISEEAREASRKDDADRLDEINDYQKEAKSLRRSIQAAQDAADEVNETLDQVSARLDHINDTDEDDSQEAVVQLNSIEGQVNTVERVISRSHRVRGSVCLDVV